MDADTPPSRLHILGKVIRAVVLVWLGLLLFLGLTQRSMIYFPLVENQTSIEREAAAKGLRAWRNSSGKTIGFCSIAPSSGHPRASVLVFHGNAGHAMQRAVYIPILRDASPGTAMSVYFLEYPGYGSRIGSPSQETLIAAARDAVAQMPADEKLLLLGESLGSGVACAVAADQPNRIHGLLLITPFDSLSSVARHHYPLLPVDWVLLDRYPTAEWLDKFSGPCVFVLAAEDTVIPPECGAKLNEAYGGPKKLITVQGATHNNLRDMMTPSEWRDTLEFILAE
jgi:pimeloyl-ACP methyl ester carboxylesterase